MQYPCHHNRIYILAESPYKETGHGWLVDWRCTVIGSFLLVYHLYDLLKTVFEQFTYGCFLNILHLGPLRSFFLRFLRFFTILEFFFLIIAKQRPELWLNMGGFFFFFFCSSSLIGVWWMTIREIPSFPCAWSTWRALWRIDFLAIQPCRYLAGFSTVLSWVDFLQKVLFAIMTQLEKVVISIARYVFWEWADRHVTYMYKRFCKERIDGPHLNRTRIYFNPFWVDCNTWIQKTVHSFIRSFVHWLFPIFHIFIQLNPLRNFLRTLRSWTISHLSWLKLEPHDLPKSSWKSS